MKPQNGDILVSNPTATVAYDLTTVGETASVACANHTAAVAQAKELARLRRVDAWLTEDHTHFLKIAAGRQPANERA
jgi:hypothetical protein